MRPKGTKSANTLRAYQSDWAHFRQWCAERGKDALPATPEMLLQYLKCAAGASKPSTISRRVWAVCFVHTTAGLPSPSDAPEVRRAVRRLSARPVTPTPRLDSAQVAAMVDALPASLGGLRDRALLLLASHGLRYADLAEIRAEGVDVSAAGVRITSRGRGHLFPFLADVRQCPARALTVWMAAARITHGPVFRAVDRHGNVSQRGLSDSAARLIVRRAAQLSGIADGTATGALRSLVIAGDRL